MGNVNFKLDRSYIRFKRKLSDDSEDSRQVSFRIPSKRKKLCTSDYIYHNLFELSEGSDIKIKALDHTWNLHKLYLNQSPYFKSMFTGGWAEANCNEISIGIDDPNITVTALTTAFSSFYKDYIDIPPVDAVSILAVAMLFQMENLISQCTGIMMENVCVETVILYHEAASNYGLLSLSEHSIEWLKLNLCTKLLSSLCHLKLVSCDLMVEILRLPDMLVIQSEFSLYYILKIWLFLKLNQDWEGNVEECLTATQEFCQKFSEDTPFLSTDEGREYIPVFSALRLEYLLDFLTDIEAIEQDHIIPKAWFTPIIRERWLRMLQIQQGIDDGPKDVAENDFFKHSMRVGNNLVKDETIAWRWSGYKFGLDVIFHYEHGKLIIQCTNTGRSSSDNIPRFLMCHVSVYSLKSNGMLKTSVHSQLTTIRVEKQIQNKVIRKKKSKVLVYIPCDVNFPLFIGANFLFTSLQPTSASNCNVENVEHVTIA